MKLDHKSGQLKSTVDFRPQVDAAKGQATFCITREVIDRDGDLVRVAGLDWQDFLRNPVVLLQHAADQMPIGRCISIWRTSDAVYATVQFDMDDPVANAVFAKVKNQFLSATSIGFKPDSYRPTDDGSGYIFDSATLLEFSIVSIPSNPAALLVPGSVKSHKDVVPETRCEPSDITIRYAANLLIDMGLAGLLRKDAPGAGGLRCTVCIAGRCSECAKGDCKCPCRAVELTMSERDADAAIDEALDAARHGLT